MDSSMIIIQIVSVLVSISIVGQAKKNGALNGGLKRGFVGGSTGAISVAWLDGYEGTESFLNAALNGSLGFMGTVFIVSFFALILVWVVNLIAFRRLIT